MIPRPLFSTSLDYFATSLLLLVRFLTSLMTHSSHVLSLSTFPWAPAVKPDEPATEPAGKTPPTKVPIVPQVNNDADGVMVLIAAVPP